MKDNREPGAVLVRTARVSSAASRVITGRSRAGPGRDGGQRLTLGIVGPAIVVEVETGLPHGHHPGVDGQRLYLGKRRVVKTSGPLRMAADGGEYLRKTLGQLHRVACALKVNAHLNDEPYARLLGFGDQDGRVFGAMVEMSMGIDQHRMGSQPRPAVSVLDAGEERRTHAHHSPSREKTPGGFAPGGSGDARCGSTRNGAQPQPLPDGRGRLGHERV